MDISKLTEAQLDAILAGDVSSLTEAQLDDILGIKPQVKDEGALRSFFHGARSMVQGVGRDLGIVSPEDYSKTYQKGKEASQLHPFATGAGQVAAVMVPAIGAAALAPAVPFAGAALGASTASAMVGASEYSRLKEEKATPLEALQGADLASDMATLGVALPGGLGTTLGSRVATGVGMNVPLGVGQRAIEKDIIHKDRPDLQVNPFDPTAMAIDVIGGGLGGVAAHVGAPRSVIADADAKAKAALKELESTQKDMSAEDISKHELSIIESQLAREKAKVDRLAQEAVELEKADVSGRSVKEAQERQAANLERIEQIKEKIRISQEAQSKLENSATNQRVALGIESPSVFRSQRPLTDIRPADDSFPSSLPPRPEGDVSFTRQEEPAVQAEQARNADMFDQEPSPNVFTNRVGEQPLEPGTGGMRPEVPVEPTIRQDDSRIDQETPSGQTDTQVPTRASVKDLALQKQQAAGWNPDWPFVPADLQNKDFVRMIKEDPSLSIEEKTQILSAGEKLGVVSKADTIISESIEITAPRETGTIDEIEAGIPAARPDGPVITGGSNTIRSLVTEWLNKLGLSKENIDVKLGREDADLAGLGDARVLHDGTAVVRVASEESLQRALGKDPKLRHQFARMTTEQAAKFREAWTAAHELGHVLFARLLRNDIYRTDISNLLNEFAEWKAKTDIKTAREVANMFSKPKPHSPDYFLDFPEFFAQRVARELMMGKTSRSSPIKQFVATMRSFWNDAIKKLGLTHAFKPNFVDHFITDIIAQNKAALDSTGKTLFEVQSVHDSLPMTKAWELQRELYDVKPTDALGAEPTIKAQKRLEDAIAARTRINATYTIEDVEQILKVQKETGMLILLLLVLHMGLLIILCLLVLSLVWGIRNTLLVSMQRNYCLQIALLSNMQQT